MADGDKKDEPPPKTKGEQLAEKLAGSNPVEPKPVAGEVTPASEMKSESAPAKALSPAEKLAAWQQKAAAAEEAANPKPAAKPAAAAKKQVDAERMPPDKKAQEAKESAGREDESIPPPPPWYRTLRADPPVHIRFALGAGLIALVFGLWWLLTRGGPTEAFISPSKLTSPGDTFGSLGKLTDRDLFDSIIDSLQRVFLGVGLAALVGIVLGVTAGAHRGVSATIAPLVIFLRSVPMGAMLPLTAMMFGDGEKQKWLFIFLAVVPFVFSDVVKAVSSVPDRYVETAQTLGASRMQIIMKVLVPLSLPDIVTSLRFQIGLALGYIILAEAGSTFVAHGLGKMIAVSERIGPREHIFLLLFVITLIAFGIDLLLRTLQRGLFAWRKDL
ncbi:MAG: ABC transporter permease [Myxococcota bacterium]|nr:ABC transporter permease [Myxococcota bacterium]